MSHPASRFRLAAHLNQIRRAVQCNELTRARGERDALLEAKELWSSHPEDTARVRLSASAVALVAADFEDSRGHLDQVPERAVHENHEIEARLRLQRAAHQRADASSEDLVRAGEICANLEAAEVCAALAERPRLQHQAHCERLYLQVVRGPLRSAPHQVRLDVLGELIATIGRWQREDGSDPPGATAVLQVAHLGARLGVSPGQVFELALGAPGARQVLRKYLFEAETWPAALVPMMKDTNVLPMQAFQAWRLGAQLLVEDLKGTEPVINHYMATTFTIGLAQGWMSSSAPLVQDLPKWACLHMVEQATRLYSVYRRSGLRLLPPRPPWHR